MDTIDICNKFDFEGKCDSCERFGSGHINKTYIAKYNTPNGVQKYVIQKINGNVFKNIDDLMDNVFAVTSYLRRVIAENGGDPDRETLHYIKTKDGQKYYCDGNDFYRAYVFVKDSVSYDSVDSAKTFMSSGIAFGRFQKLLSGFNADSLAETIPNFHNTPWRYEHEFIPAVERDSYGRKDDCADLIEEYVSRRDVMSRLVDMVDRGEIPLRVTHNDTKLNNVMFDSHTGECICVIDLDTVMPGLALYDFGDSIRFGASTATEDEQNLDLVSMDMDYFAAYAKGFLSECGDYLTPAEKDNLAFAAMLMTLECGMRFLTDYLNGDTYFRTEYPGQNLARSRNQMKLVKDMEQKMDEMKKIIKAL